MSSMNISLPETLRSYVEEQTTLGGYGTVSEYLRELIREDRKRKAEERLEALLLEGLDSGESVPVTPDYWRNVWERVDARMGDKRKASE
ncbi:MAG TPA: type II toxin-antitoxin system ParD family antitoxin [Chthonomonadaceae bacterium]|nr:type II toxin-antitoxin system ParD family antitoxin [Chthonomonadaceae bacterium]